MRPVIDHSIRLKLELAPYETATDEGIIHTYLTSITWDQSERGVLIPREIDEEATLYPEFGCARFYHRDQLPPGLVITFMNRKWRVIFTPIYEWPENLITPAGGTIEFLAVNEGEAETPWKNEEDVFDNDLQWPKPDEYTLRLFGQPHFMQQDLAFRMSGASHALPVFLVFYDGWGDMGNWNVFVDVDENGNPARAYYEYACG